MKQDTLFQLFFETVNEPTLILQGTEIVAGNAPARALLQSERDLTGQSLLQWVAGATGTEQVPAQIATVLNDKPQSYLWQVQRPDGTTLPVQTTLSRLSNGSTSWVKAQLNSSPTPIQTPTLRQVIDLVPHFIFAKDRHGRFVLVNQAVAQAYGTTVEQLLGKTDADFNPNAEEVEHFRKDDLEVMDSLCEKLIPEEVITDTSGKQHWLQTIKRPIIGTDDKANYILGVATDITSLKEVEQDLRIQETRQRALLEAIPDLICQFDQQGTFLDYKADEASLYIPPAQVIGKKLSEIWPLSIAMPALHAIQQALQTRQPQLFEYKISLSDNQTGDFEARIVPIDQETVLMLGREITQRKQAEASLTASQKELVVQTQSLTLINKIAATLYSSRDFDKIASQAGDAIMAYANAPSAGMFSLNEVGDTLHLLWAKGFTPEVVQAAATLPVAGSLSGITILRREIITSDDILNDERLEPHVKQALLRQGLKNVISIPILFQTQVLGVLNLIFNQKPQITTHERHTLLAIGNTIGLALSNAQYLSRLETEAKERQRAQENLSNQLQYGAGLAAASKVLLTDSPEAMGVALQHLQKSSQVSHVALYKNFEQLNDTVLQAGLVVEVWDGDLLEGDRISWGETLSYAYELPHWEKELAKGRTVAGTVHNSPPKEQNLLRRAHILSILLLPIHIGGTWYGFLSLENKNRVDKWEEATIQILQTATELIANYLERKQTVTALVTSEQRFRDLAENSPDTIFILDLKLMKSLYINRSSFLGYGRDELASPSFFRNTHPDDLEGLRQHWNRVFDGVQETYEYRVQSKEGGWEWVQNREVPLVFDANGRPSQVLVTLTIVTTRKLLETQIQESLQRRSQQIELTTRIAQEIASATQLDRLYQRIVDRVKETFGYSHAQLFRYDPTREAMGLVVGYGGVGQKMLAVRHALPMGRGLVGTAASTGQSFLRPNVAGDPDWVPNRFLPDTKGELAVPIKLGERVLGVLDVQSNIANQLSTEDQLLLEGLCGQIAIAIESTRLSESLAEQLRELTNLQRLMTREGWRSRQTSKRLQGVVFDSSQGEIREADLPALWQQPRTSGVPSSSMVPIAIRGEVIGSLGIMEDPEHPLPAEDQELLETISTQIAEALETARLLEQTQKRAVELEAVAQVSTAATTILDSNKLLESVVSYTQASFQLYQVSVLLFDPITKHLTSRAVAGIERSSFASHPFDPAISLETVSLSQEPSVVAKAARTRQGVLITDSLTDPDFLPYHLAPHTRSEIAVPMLAGNELVGVLDLQADTPNYFTTEDVRTYTTLASQVAVALQNARLYQDQLETAEKLREVERLKSQFLANMSHELRTPLNSIIGFSDVLLEGIEGPMNPRMEEDVRMIRTSGQYLRELIGDILDMSKIEAGMMELRKEWVYVPYIVAEIVALQQPFAENKGLELEVQAPADLPYLYADPTRLRQILINLVSNGIKFTDTGQVTIQITNYPHQMHFSVKDSGIGLYPQDIPIIFQEFRQVDESLARRAGGTGLGLPISKHLVELHGGQIGVESNPNSGSTFWFTIPH